MRKWNAVISMLIVVLFFVHAVAGGFNLIGIIPGGNPIFTALSYLLLGLVVMHVLIGIKLTIDTVLAKRRAGVFYYKENKMFLARRISGFAIFLLMISHILIFMGNEEAGSFRLNYFGKLQLVAQLLLVLSIAVHIISNIKPVLIAFGIRSLKEYAADIIIIISVLLLFMGLAFCLYYVRWKIF